MDIIIYSFSVRMQSAAVGHQYLELSWSADTMGTLHTKDTLFYIPSVKSNPKYSLNSYPITLNLNETDFDNFTKPTSIELKEFHIEFRVLRHQMKPYIKIFLLSYKM